MEFRFNYQSYQETIRSKYSHLFDLQRFASAESEGRTEQATEHKKRKAREEGRVALSKDLPSAVVTIVTFAVVVALSGYILKTLSSSFTYVFENFTNLRVEDPVVYRDTLLYPCLKILAPIFGAAFLAALISNYGQIGFKMTLKAIKPDFKKISPNVFKFFKKQVFSATGFFNLMKSVVKIAIIVLVAFFTVTGKLDTLLTIADYESLEEAFGFIASLCMEVVFKAALLFLLFSVIDIMFVRYQHAEQLKMKKEEVKQEHKEMEGDPQIKSKIKELYRSMMSQQKMLAQVPESDVVITNPTHFAVALKYDRVVDIAPRVIAKGKDAVAQEIKKIAAENNIYMYENVPLARKLYAEVQVNEIVPEELFGVIVVAYKLAYQYKERNGAGV